MDSARGVGRIVGLLLLVHLTVGLMTPFILLDPGAQGTAGLLANAAGSAALFRTAALLLVVGSAMALAVAVAGGRVFRRQGESTASALLALAVAAFALQVVDAGALMSILALSQEYARPDALKGDLHQALAVVIGAGRRWVHYSYLLVAVSWIMLLNAALFRFRLVPRALAAPGVAACLLQIAGVSAPGLLRDDPHHGDGHAPGAGLPGPGGLADDQGVRRSTRRSDWRNAGAGARRAGGRVGASRAAASASFVSALRASSSVPTSGTIPTHQGGPHGEVWQGTRSEPAPVLEARRGDVARRPGVPRHRPRVRAGRRLRRCPGRQDRRRADRRRSAGPRGHERVLVAARRASRGRVRREVATSWNWPASRSTRITRTGLRDLQRFPRAARATGHRRRDHRDAGLTGTSCRPGRGPRRQGHVSGEADGPDSPEDQVLRAAVQKNSRVFQFGTQQRSSAYFRRACEIVRNGHIGKLKHINVWCPGSAPGGSTEGRARPGRVNYDLWLGPAPFTPYREDNCSADGAKKTWWFNSDYALGFIAGWGVHPLDIALWGHPAMMSAAAGGERLLPPSLPRAPATRPPRGTRASASRAA